jgi:hypothetical protein
MAIDPTAYGVVYGSVSTAQKKANRLAMAAAIDAAILAADYVLIPGVVVEICCIARNNTLTTASLIADAYCSITRSGAVGCRGIGENLSQVQLYVDFGDGNPVKVINNQQTMYVVRASATAVLSITRAGSITTLTYAGANFLTNGCVAGDVITLAGFANAGNNGTFAVANVLSETQLRLTNAASVTETSGAGASYAVGPVPASNHAGFMYSGNANVTWDVRDFELVGHDSTWTDATRKDIWGGLYGINHNSAGGTNHVTSTDVRTTGRIVPIQQQKGDCTMTITRGHYQSHMTTFSMFDNKTVKGKGTVTCIAGSSINDGETLTLNDGTTSVVFEFDKDGSVTPGRTAIAITNAYTSTQVRDAVIATINGVSGFHIDAFPQSTTKVRIAQDSYGNTSSSAAEGVANAGFTVSWSNGSTPPVATSSARHMIWDGVDIDVQGIRASESSDADDHGLGGYLHPHGSFKATNCILRNVARVGVKQYSQSDSVAFDYGGYLPQCPGEAAGVGFAMRNITYINVSCGDSGASLFDTTDAAVTAIADNITTDNVPANGAQINARCSLLQIRNSPNLKNVQFQPLGTAEARQDEVTIDYDSSTIVESRAGKTTFDMAAGWHLVLGTTARVTHSTTDSNSFAFKGPYAPDTNYPTAGSITTRTGSRIHSDSLVQNGDVFRITSDAPVTIEEGTEFSGTWRSVFDMFSNGQLDVTLEGDGPDLTDLTSSYVVFFQDTGGGTALADSIRGCIGNAPMDNAVRWSNFQPGTQYILCREVLDPTTRTSSGGRVEVHPGYGAATVNGATDSLQIGPGTAQDQNYAFEGTRYVLVAGAGFIANSGGNMSYLSTGAKAAGAHMHFVLTAGVWVEHTISVSPAVTDAVADEEGPDTGTVVVTRTGSKAIPLVVNLTLGGTAAAGPDYTPIASVTIPAGSASASVTVTPLADVAAEGDETVTIAVGAGSYYTAAGAPVTVTITDDPPPAEIPWPTGQRARLYTDTPVATLTMAGGEPAGLQMGFPELNAPSWRQFRLLSPEEIEE